jgi:hypothetical protein
MNNNKDNLLIQSNDTFKDIVLKVTSVKKDFFNDFEILAENIYNNQTVGMKIIVRSNLQPGIENGEIKPELQTKGGVQFKSVGKNSDLFVVALSNFYGIPGKNTFTIKSVVANCLALTNMHFDVMTDKIKLLLTFDPDNKRTLFSEIYMDLDLCNNTISLSEKDQEWRRNIVELLTT